MLPVWSESPWQAGIGSLLRLVYDAHPWAVIGGVDGATTHLALQVALKSHFVLLTPASTDPSTERANVAWLFSLPPSDEALASQLVPGILGEAGRGPIAIAASADHDGHAALEAVVDALRPLRITPAALVEYPPADEDLRASVARVLAPAPRAVLVLGPAVAAGRLVRAVRAGGFGGAIVGSATATTDAFRQAAGDAVDGVIAAAPVVAGPAWSAFADAYRARWGRAPDADAANGYDAVRLVAAAIQQAGLNRARIRDTLPSLAPWSGVGGAVNWDGSGRNQRPVLLSSWKDGHYAVPGLPR